MFEDWAAADLTARARRDEGIQRSAETAGNEWLDYARDFLRQYLTNHPTLHIDDLWSSGLVEPESMRGVGHVIREAKTVGWIEHITTPEGWVCAKPSVKSNCQLKAVWRSLIYHGG